MSPIYTPRAGTIPDKAIKYLQQHGPTPGLKLAEVLGLKSYDLPLALRTAERLFVLQRINLNKRIWWMLRTQDEPDVETPVQRVIPAGNAPPIDVPPGASSVFAMAQSINE